MRAIIIEDEPLSVAELRTTLAEVAPQIEVVATASSVAEAAAVIAGVGHDLIFMDIHLGDGSGFDIFQRTEISVPVIFITAYDSYALKAFENKGIDYLLKPFDFADFQRAAGRLLKQASLASARQAVPDEDYLLVKDGYKYVSIRTTDILYIQGMRDYAQIHVEGRKPVMAGTSMAQIREKLPACFMQVHRSWIVNVRKVREIERMRIVIGGERIPVGDNYKQQFLDFLRLHTLDKEK